MRVYGEHIVHEKDGKYIRTLCQQLIKMEPTEIVHVVDDKRFKTATTCDSCRRKFYLLRYRDRVKM